MLLTNCAACAAPLSLDAPKCVRCRTRYCDAECQREHWKRGGHKKKCEEIAEDGGAEYCNALAKAQKAWTDALMACAGDVPAIATCHVCGKGMNEGPLARGCSCLGWEGFAHLRCLVDIAREAKLSRTQPSWTRWTTCRCCDQEFHGVVRCALGWSCWHTYVDKPDYELRARAMTEVGIGLMEVGKYEEAFRVLEATVIFQRNLSFAKNKHASKKGLTSEEFTNRLLTQGCLATCCSKLGWQTSAVYPAGKPEGSGVIDSGGKLEGALTILHRVFEGASRHPWANAPHTTTDIRHRLALGLAECLLAEHWVGEARRLLSGVYRDAERDFGEEHATTIGLYFQLAQNVYKMHFFGGKGYRGVLIDTIGMHAGIHMRSARVLGIDHPLTRKVAAGFLRCFEEQLDWSLDDIPSEHLAYRARLLGN